MARHPTRPPSSSLPAVDAQYRADDTFGGTHGKTLQVRTLARLATCAEGYDIPVLVTRNEQNEFTEPVVTAADHHLECEQTRMGPRIVGEDFETLVYPVDDGIPDDVRILATAARGTRHAGRSRADNTSAVDTDSGGRRDGRHS